MKKHIERGKFRMLYNESSNSTKTRKWLKRTISKLRRIDQKEQVRNELRETEYND